MWSMFLDIDSNLVSSRLLITVIIISIIRSYSLHFALATSSFATVMVLTLLTSIYIIYQLIRACRTPRFAAAVSVESPDGSI